MVKIPKNAKIHDGCGGGVLFESFAFDGKPQFRCSKCNMMWTCGRDGGRWASLVPKASHGL